MDNGRIIRVNMNELTVRQETVPERYRFMGGRSLTSRLVFDEVQPNCDPLGSDNKLVLAPGYLSGTGAPCSGRLSVGGKSPLT
ncbi:MAG: aldehyde ferredoxin oxidoreductase N-terminal domain-containing protein, partial [Bacillota bacterium]|nr:aldehyde ferredoxin oxidoreductase N-terminal domain-containing protein [Bacillota bacterium]